MNRSQKLLWGATSLMLVTGLLACDKSSESGTNGKNAQPAIEQTGQAADKPQPSTVEPAEVKSVATNVEPKSVDAGKAVIPEGQPVVSNAVEKGVMAKADEMKAEPFRDAKSLKSLLAGEKLEILSRQGGWYKVNVGKATGWVHMLSVRKGDAKKGSNDAAGLLALSSGRAGTGTVVATTGVRGLNEAELKAAKFDEAELLRAEASASSKADAAQFAKQGELVARPFNYLPAK